MTLRIDARHILARFDPSLALGATIDAHERDESRKVFAPAIVQAMLSAGFHPLSYRLATELGGEAWHWNPRGTWSGDRSGYWISSPDPGEPIGVSYGYRLPRRGNTKDQAHDDGYSRIDDGDRSTFWKSNPYLHDRPQWVLIDLGALHPVDHIDITWGDPYATEFESQFWQGDDPINAPAQGRWRRMTGTVHARYLRVWMTRSSETGGTDWRDRTGFAIREISVLYRKHDWVRHAASHEQSVIWVSSTDPWHRANDIDTSMEQLGLDAVFASGLTRGLPMLTPVSLLYGIPEDAAAEISYLLARHYAVKQIEMGEEPDGQNMAPEDYAMLYGQWAEAIHHVDPSLQLGGPSFQSTRDVIAFWPDESGRTSWIARFLSAVHRSDFNFFSFEWYPFDEVCSSVSAQLAEAPHVLRRVLGGWRREGVPPDIPWIASEYGWSSYAAQAGVDFPAALFNAEFVADFLASGGSTAYLYGYEPDVLITEQCNQYGALTLFLGDKPVPAYYAAQLVTKEWLQERGTHELYAVSGATKLVPAYAVKRPDGTWSLLIINLGRTSTRLVGLKGDVVQYSQRDYEWRAAGEHGRATRNQPPRRFRAGGSIELPRWSITVVILGSQDGVEALSLRRRRVFR